MITADNARKKVHDALLVKENARKNLFSENKKNAMENIFPKVIALIEKEIDNAINNTRHYVEFPFEEWMEDKYIFQEVIDELKKYGYVIYNNVQATVIEKLAGKRSGISISFYPTIIEDEIELSGKYGCC